MRQKIVQRNASKKCGKLSSVAESSMFRRDFLKRVQKVMAASFFEAFFEAFLSIFSGVWNAKRQNKGCDFLKCVQKAMAAYASAIVIFVYFQLVFCSFSLSFRSLSVKSQERPQSRLRLVFAPHTSASRRKVEERLQSAALTEAHFSSNQGGL